MPLIKITVRNKIASADKSVVYICGNSDYNLRFDFDSEWDSFTSKTARIHHGESYTDVVFNGNECALPVLRDVYNFKVGVYAGNLHTTTPATVFAKKSILCEGGVPADPAPNVYNQIMDAVGGKQDKLVQGNGIRIEGNVISAVGGGGSSYDDTEIRQMIAEKADADHTHSYNSLTDKPVIPAAYDDTAIAGRVTAIEGKEAGWDGKQDKLTAGENITIADDGTISADGGAVDVQINGTSITQDGVANIPYATASNAGVVKQGYGIQINTNGAINTNPASESMIDSRNNFYAPLIPNRLNYAVKAALSDSKRIGMNNDGMTDDEMANACAVIGAERKLTDGWVLKGTLTTENKSTGCNVDLAGCTQLLLYGNAVVTGGVSILLNGALAAYNVVTTSGKYFYSYFQDSIFGYCFAYGKSAGLSQTNIETAGRGYSKMDGTHLSDITIITWNNSTNVTECEVKIYAR